MFSRISLDFGRRTPTSDPIHIKFIDSWIKSHQPLPPGVRIIDLTKLNPPLVKNGPTGRLIEQRIRPDRYIYFNDIDKYNIVLNEFTLYCLENK